MILIQSPLLLGSARLQHIASRDISRSFVTRILIKGYGGLRVGRYYHGKLAHKLTGLRYPVNCAPTVGLKNIWRLGSTLSDFGSEIVTSVKTDEDSTCESKHQTAKYILGFKCKVCNENSTHQISKQGYHHGTVIAQCPKCKNRHLISDNLKIFSDHRMTIQDIMKRQGESVRLIQGRKVQGTGNAVEILGDDSHT